MKLEKATFAAGCFWGVEETFRTLPGVKKATSGYTGGNVKNPTWEQVCTDTTGHVEAVEIEFNPEKMSYEMLLEVFWKSHDPTQKNGQWPNLGKHYRSVIFFHSKAQEKAARDSKARLEKEKRFSRPIATEILPAAPFYRAEEYHQKFLQKRGLASCHF